MKHNTFFYMHIVPLSDTLAIGNAYTDELSKQMNITEVKYRPTHYHIYTFEVENNSH